MHVRCNTLPGRQESTYFREAAADNFCIASPHKKTSTAVLIQAVHRLARALRTTTDSSGGNGLDANETLHRMGDERGHGIAVCMRWR
jgi:hypothetical protein